MASDRINKAILERIDSLALSERLKRQKEAYLNAPRMVCVERDKIAMEAWKETEGQPIELRSAMILKKILEGVPVAIHDGQLIAGSDTKYLRGAYLSANYDPTWVLGLMEQGKITLGSPKVVGKISEEDWQAAEEIARFFKGKTGTHLAREVGRSLWGSWYEDLVENRGSTSYLTYTPSTGVPMVEKVLDKGLRGIIREAEVRIERFAEMGGDDPEKLWFWQAAIIVCQALINLAKRYAQLARELALVEKDAVRRVELEEIAQVCERVPENPARTFREAIQSVCFIQLGLKLEQVFLGASLGRPDQYLYPYFMTDLEEGRITLERAADLLGDLILFPARYEHVVQTQQGQHTQNTTISNMVLGGVTKDGKDANNELTYLLLHMAGLVKCAEPHIICAWHRGTPRWSMMKALETNRKTGGGLPHFQNGDHVVDMWVKRGIPLEDARDWAVVGCTAPVPNCSRSDLKVATVANMALALDLALHNGVGPLTGKRVGLETGDPRSFKTFDDLYEAFTKQWEFILRRLLQYNRLAHRAEIQRWRMPLTSSLLPGCIEKGQDFLAGGLQSYASWCVKDRGFVDTADSLTAVKKLVFKDKKLTMSELLEALDSDFQGERGEDIRQMCLAAPKYGNDIDEADLMVRDLGKFSASIISQEKNVFGERYVIDRHGLAFHYYAGKGVGALPNGRKARQPLADGSLSPMGGLDTQGPTATLASALKADFKEALVAVLNQKFSASFVRSQEAMEKLAMLTEGFMANGGTHIQYNLIDKQTLLEAKKHPEQYRDLLVRVAGYSAYFIDLTPEVQDEIICRTEQTL